jgi:L-rhamnose mutarotase
LDIELIYNLKINYKENYRFQIGNNFLYELKDIFREYNLNFINSLTNYQYNNSYSYFKFFPINCQIEIKNLDAVGKLEKNQELIPHSKQNYNYNVKRVDNKNESCQFYVSTYSIELNRTFNEMESAIISKNIPHYSIFNKEIKKIKYFYPHTEIENNLMVNFTIKNETKDNYTFCAYINEYQICKKNSERENSLTFSSSEIAKRCKDEKQICNIYFVLETNNKTESTVEIKVISFSNPNSENFFKKNLKIILIIVGGVTLLLIIIILNICFCRGKKKSDLSVEVNQISFGEEGERDKKKDAESLLS